MKAWRIARRLKDFLLCRKNVEEGEFRIVYLWNKTTTSDPNVDVVDPHAHFTDNVVVTSKYKLWNFAPKNLFEQFRRVANFYFLCVVLVQFGIADKTPVSPMTSLLPLAFVITVTAVKQGYEDWKRHQADKEVNNKPTLIVKNGSVEEVYSKNIKVGDVVKVNNDEEFPCDLVILSSSKEEGHCHIMTANLDGETNLKVRCSIQATAKMHTPELLETLQGRVECDHPDFDMYRYNGRFILSNGQEESVAALGPSNLLLRGARLRNTEFIYGLAVYTGKQTKMALNQQEKRTKFSTVEKSMNTFLLIFLGVLLLETTICTGLKYRWQGKPYGKPWYLPQHPATGFLEVFVDFLAFLILFNYIIPISLYVTVELQKFSGSLLFNWDLELYHEPTDEPAKANTSDLNEELGQIEYVFSDKTGTLTENDMIFRQCSVKGRRLMDERGLLLDCTSGEQVDLTQDRDVKEFFVALALCHTVQADENNGGNSEFNFIYQASSPDEKALVEAAHKVGLIYQGKRSEVMELNTHGVIARGLLRPVNPASRGETAKFLAGLYSNVQYSKGSVKQQGVTNTTREIRHLLPLGYKVLHVLEFDSTRKRMSIIIETPEGDVVMLCKGAESHVLDRIVCGPTQETQDHIDQYAELGLRTLTIASKTMSKSEYEEIDRQLTAAQQAITDREELLARVFEEVEQGFTLLGATAVEDRLQDGVRITIESLREAGIKVWVLTGDKLETAVNISHSCGHFQSSMEIMYLVHKKELSDIKETLDEYLSRTTVRAYPAEFAIVVDGATLALIMDNFADMFLRLGEVCVAVLCCRMSPLQKAQLFLRSYVLRKSPVHGKGPWFSHAADYLRFRFYSYFDLVCIDTVKFLACAWKVFGKPVATFKDWPDLQVVRLVKHSSGKPITLAIGDGANDCSMIQEAHVGCGIMGKEGRQAVRTSDYAFHRFRYLKRVVLVHGHYYYSRLATVVLYFFYKNIAFITPQFFFQFTCGFSALPIYSGVFLTCFNIFFTSLPIMIFGIFEKDLETSTLMDHPCLYRELARNNKLSWRQFFYWVMAGLWHAIVFYVGGQWLFGEGSFNSDLLEYGVTAFGVFVFTTCVLITNLKLAIITHFWTWLTHFCMWGSILFYVVFLLVLCAFLWPWPALRSWFHLPLDLELYYVIYMLFDSAAFWFALAALLLIALLPDIMGTVVFRYLRPTRSQVAQEEEKDPLYTIDNRIANGVDESISNKTETLSVHSGRMGGFEKDDVQLINVNANARTGNIY